MGSECSSTISTEDEETPGHRSLSPAPAADCPPPLFPGRLIAGSSSAGTTEAESNDNQHEGRQQQLSTASPEHKVRCTCTVVCLHMYLETAYTYWYMYIERTIYKRNMTCKINYTI